MLIERQKELSNELWKCCNFEDDYNIRYAVSTGTWGKKFGELLTYIGDEVGTENRALILNDLNEDGFSIVSRITKYSGFMGNCANGIIDELLKMGAHPVASGQCLSVLFSSPAFMFDKFMLILDEADFNGSPVVIKGHDGNPFHDPEFLKGYIFWLLPPNPKEDIRSSKKWLEQRRDSDGALPIQVLYDAHMNTLREFGAPTQPVMSNLVLEFVANYLDSTDANGLPLWNRIEKDISDGILIPGINLPARITSFIEERQLEGQTQTIGSRLRKPHRL